MSDMTPREQIEKEENLRYPSQHPLYNSIVRAGFKEGAEYGYNLALERVVKLLEDKLGYVPVIPQGLPEDVVKAQTERANRAYNFIQDLKQAMKYDI